MNELILLVDDEPLIVQQARDYLEHGGFRVLSAGDGRQALALAREVEARAPERSPELPERVEALCAELSRLEAELLSRSAQLGAG